ncbi:MAG: extracellular solute-binding protein [Roseiflexaceae bacterium]
MVTHSAEKRPSLIRCERLDAVASGTPPDVVWVDGPQVAEWAARGVLEPLDDLIGTAGIKPEDFWTPSWNQTVYNKKVWALTRSSDANFGFYWNKDIFKEVGLDPEKPPQTIAEGAGLLVQLGLKNAMVSADCRLLTAKACGSRQSPVGSHSNCGAISAALY